MRVCFIGSARYIKPLSPTLKKKFFSLATLGQIYVVGFSEDSWPRHFTEKAHFYLIPNLRSSILRYLIFFALAPALALWLVMRRKVSILVAQSPYEGFAAAWAKILARFFQKKVAVIVESHGDFETSLFLQRSISHVTLYQGLMRQAAKFSLGHADALRAISNSTRKQLETWSPEKPLVQFATWTDIDVFLEDSNPTTQARKEKLIVYAGVLTPLKGIHFLLEAFSDVVAKDPAAELLLVGKPEIIDYARDLKKLASSLELKDRIRFIDPVPQRKLAAYMRQAWVFVLPSLSEGLGRVVFEAMACGTPVIASRVGGIPELVQDGLTGYLVQPGDVEMLADRLKWLLSHPEETFRMGREARAFASRYFSTEAYMAGYNRLFMISNSLLNKARFITH
jgi:glycosyltransferase involved in cell wall biosynthesis